jgi:trigger factor
LDHPDKLFQKEPIAVSEMSVAVKIDDISSVKKKLFFDVPWADVKNEMDIVYRKLGKKAKIKGFRQGKVPRAMLEKYYRSEAEEETVSNLINRYYWETLQEKNLAVVSQPDIDQKGIETEKNFSFSATVEIEPSIEPKDYLGLELEEEELVVSEADIDRRMQEIRQMFATMEEMNEDRGIIAGDFVTIDFQGNLAGESLKELKSENHLIEIGSKSFVPGFEDQLVGMRKGEEKTITVTFPNDYHAEHIAGKDVVFEVSVKGIRLKRLPELDEQFVKNFDKYESLQALREDVRHRIESEKRRKIDIALERQISDRILERNNLEVPDSFVERQIYYMMADMQRRMASSGMDPQKAADFSAKLHDQFKDEAAKIVKTVFLIRAIAAKEALTVEEEEVEREIREMAAHRAQDYELLRKSLEKEGMIDNIRNEVLNRKTYGLLKEKAQITTVKGDHGNMSEAKK